MRKTRIDLELETPTNGFIARNLILKKPMVSSRHLGKSSLSKWPSNLKSFADQVQWTENFSVQEFSSKFLTIPT
jgi:hypothetical protein